MKISHSGSKAQYKGIPETMIRRIFTLIYHLIYTRYPLPYTLHHHIGPPRTGQEDHAHPFLPGRAAVAAAEAATNTSTSRAHAAGCQLHKIKGYSPKIKSLWPHNPVVRSSLSSLSLLGSATIMELLLWTCGPAQQACAVYHEEDL